MGRCLRIGEVNALDLLTEGESLDSAVESITSRVGDADCETLRSDMRCMQANPCYKNAVKKLPITFDMDTMEEVKVDYDTCGVTCTGDIAAELAKTADDATFTITDGECTQKIETEADCKKASETQLGGKTYKFKKIRYQKRPKGCFQYKKKVYWNAVKTGKVTKGRNSVCLNP